jgi:hypothetical protein
MNGCPNVSKVTKVTKSRNCWVTIVTELPSFSALRRDTSHQETAKVSSLRSLTSLTNLASILSLSSDGQVTLVTLHRGCT